MQDLGKIWWKLRNTLQKSQTIDVGDLCEGEERSWAHLSTRLSNMSLAGSTEDSDCYHKQRNTERGWDVNRAKRKEKLDVKAFNRADTDNPGQLSMEEAIVILPLFKWSISIMVLINATKRSSECWEYNQEPLHGMERRKLRKQYQVEMWMIIKK